jgi:CRISPR-associated protein Csh1
MIEAMRQLALAYLTEKLVSKHPDDSEAWYRKLRRDDPQMIFPYLVEDSGKIDRVYILERIAADLVRMYAQDISAGADGNTHCTPDKLPFMRPSGSQSAQIGPVIKRSCINGVGGPSAKILETTLSYFLTLSRSDKPWSSYFQDIYDILSCPRLDLMDSEVINWREAGHMNMLACAVDKIGPQKSTVFLTVRDSSGYLPGENEAYLKYLLTDQLAGERYTTQVAPAREHGICNLCGDEDITIFPNALKGAGINLCNVDRAGAFPGLDAANAWKNYALCANCADLLYIYKYHVLKKSGPKKDKLPFSARIAGDNALIIPSFFPGSSMDKRLRILDLATGYIEGMSSDVGFSEENLLKILKDESTIMNFVFLWSDIGQNIENVTGMITDVLPSRLRKLSDINDETENWRHPIFPKVFLTTPQTNFKPDLTLQGLRNLFYRPGGAKAKDINNSKQLVQVRRLIAECVYHERKIPLERFWDEVMTTARWYYLDAFDDSEGYKGLLYEGSGKNGPYLTCAGWIRHLAWWLYYFKKLGVMNMGNGCYEPTLESLKPYFGPESRIDKPDEAYAFLLGVLYGKLMQVQGAKGVNVSSNTLTWLKRLTLKGKDLPDLYNKIREKLLTYLSNKEGEEIREFVVETSKLGAKLGDHLDLDETTTNYYLLLGQALATEILPAKKSKEGEA